MQSNNPIKAELEKLSKEEDDIPLDNKPPMLKKMFSDRTFATV